MEGYTIGVFGTEPAVKTAIESSLGTKSEAEGTIVYHRTESSKKITFLDDTQYPERIQGYARVASIADYAFYFFPSAGRISAPDGELAVLLDSFSVKGAIELVDGSGTPELARRALKGTAVGGYPIQERNAKSTVLDIAPVGAREDFVTNGTLVYVDRAFTVKGIGTVALGFVRSGSVTVHDQLCPIPGDEGKRADVRGIQVNEEDFGSVGRGIRVGLSFRGVGPDDLQKTRWLDDGTFEVSDMLNVDFRKSSFYTQSLDAREMHVQLPGELVAASVMAGSSEEELTLKLRAPVPVWHGMRVALVDLNAKALRVAGGGSCKL
ncbi:MAG: hypothetical protein LYZ70_05695 [Nitrososphaerales archaeon]|nr:hypothetical protein [Nitrososphaerales archaeon]